MYRLRSLRFSFCFFLSCFVLIAGAGRGEARSTPGKKAPVVWKKFQHVGHQFSVSHPAGWSVLQKSIQSHPHFGFTPERSSRYAQFRVGARLWYRHVTKRSRFYHWSVEQAYRWYYPILRSSFESLSSVSKPMSLSAFVSGGLKSAKIWKWTGKLRGKRGLQSSWVVVSRQDKKLFVLVFTAPTAQMNRWRSTFRKMIRLVRLEEHYATRDDCLSRKCDAKSIVDSYKASVVQVRSGYTYRYKGKTKVRWVGTGTGFIIREDGYVITNHHVIWNRRKNRPYPRIEVVWDKKLREKDPVRFAPAQVTVLDAQLKRSKSMLIRSVDLALLRIKSPMKYKAMPITPSKSLSLGDPVITMGYPRYNLVTRNILYGLFLYVTRGIVTRLNRNLFDEIESMFVDARIDHGNSGGPCISLATGGVIGINTFYIKVMKAYSGVISVDTALKRYTQYFHLPPSFAQQLSHWEHYQLAYDYFHLKRKKPLTYMYRKVFRGSAHLPEVRYLLGEALLQKNRSKAAIALLLRNHKRYPKHYATLLSLARAYHKSNRLIRAIGALEKAMKLRPRAILPYLRRGRLYAKVGKFYEGLQDAKKAIQLSYGVWAEPHILAGHIFQKQNNWKLAMREYRFALQLDTNNFQTRLTLGEMYEKRSMYRAAILEYAKVGKDSVRLGSTKEHIARCYLKLKQPRDAYQAYTEALTAHQLNGTKPSMKMFSNLSRLVSLLKLDSSLAFRYNIMGMRYLQPRGKSAYKMHIKMAQTFYKTRYSMGIAFAHLLLAKSIRPKGKELEALSADVLPSPLRFRDLALMVRMKYTPTIVLQMFRSSYIRSKDFRSFFRRRYTLRMLSLMRTSAVMKRKIYRAILRASTRWRFTKTLIPVMTGRAKGTYYGLMRSVKKVMRRATPKVLMQVRISEGSKRNLATLSSYRSKGLFALGQYDAFLSLRRKKYLVRAYTRLVSPICNEEIHLLVRKGSKINSLRDLKGKKVSIGDYYSGTRTTVTLLMKAMGLNIYRSFKSRDYSAPGRALTRLLNKEIDALFYVVATPAKLFSRLPANLSKEIKIVSISRSLNKRVKRKLAKYGYTLTRIPKGTYPWQKKVVHTIATQTFLFVQKYSKAKDIHKLLEVLTENQKKLARLHPKWKEFSLLKLHKSYRSSLRGFYHPSVRTFLQKKPVKGVDMLPMQVKTGLKKGTYYKMVQVLSKVLKKYKYKLRLTPVLSQGSAENLDAIRYRRADFSIFQQDAFYVWLRRNFIRLQIKKLVRLITPLYREEIHLLVRKSAKVKTAKDLKRLRISVGRSYSGTAFSASNVLKALGVGRRRVKYYSTLFSFRLLLRGRIDAMFYTVGAPSRLFQKLPSKYAKQLELYTFSKAELATILRKSPKRGYQTAMIKKGTYAWQSKDVATLSVPSLLVTSKDMSSKTVALLLSALKKHSKEMAKGHVKWGEFSLGNLRRSYKAMRSYYHVGTEEFLSKNKVSKSKVNKKKTKPPVVRKKPKPTVRSKRSVFRVMINRTERALVHMISALDSVGRFFTKNLGFTPMGVSYSAGGISSVLQGQAELAVVELDEFKRIAKTPILGERMMSLTKVLAPVYYKEVHILVRKGAKITSLQSMVGRRINVGPKGSETNLSAHMFFQSSGVNTAKIKLQKLSTSEGIKRLLKGSLDGMFLTVGAPSLLLQNLPATVKKKIELLSLQPKTVARLQQNMFKTGYVPATIKSKSYVWQTKPALTFSIPCVLLGNRNLSVQKVKQILELITQHQSQLVKMQVKWSKVTLRSLRVSFASLRSFYHPGVAEFLKAHSQKNKVQKKAKKRPAVAPAARAKPGKRAISTPPRKPAPVRAKPAPVRAKPAPVRAKPAPVRAKPARRKPDKR